jgi:hypothetical protein
MVARLRELSLLGVPMSRIAEAFGVSKNAVAGARIRNCIYTSASVPKAPLPEAPPVPALNECRYILDEGPWKDRLPQWCGERTSPGSVYCPTHHARCYYAKR